MKTPWDYLGLFVLQLGADAVTSLLFTICSGEHCPACLFAAVIFGELCAATGFLSCYIVSCFVCFLHNMLVKAGFGL